MRRAAELLFLATLFVITFEKVHWEVAGTVNLSDVVSALFLAAAALARLEQGSGTGRVPRSAAVAVVFGAAFLAVYLVGFYNLETDQALAQFFKGTVKWALHFSFLVVGLTFLLRRPPRFYWHSLGALCAGVAANAVYGVLQLAYAETGGDLDERVLSPVTGGASSINVYGAVEGQDVYRPNALTGDPNHLGVMLIVPLLVLTPLYLRLERGHRLRLPLAALLSLLLAVELATLSRSGMLGLAVGMLVLAVPYRRHFATARFLVPLAIVGAGLLAIVARRADFFETVLRSRLSTETAATSPHLDVYGFIPDVLSAHPLVGLGFNNFSVYYEFVTGKTDWGPHSFYVALFVETGVVGATLFAVFLAWLFRRLAAARRLGRSLGAARDPLARRVRPLAWGLTAALAGTLAANAFYLTIPFYYFYALAMLVLAVPAVFARRPA
ncbi:MAG: O-antigen ligase family protein [Gaiellaceae bacterium]